MNYSKSPFVWRGRSVAALGLCGCLALACLADEHTAALPDAVPSFTMRIDDNHSPAEWKRVAEIFESRGMRVSFAIVPSSLSDAQGACLKELSDRGHVIMDHTPNHTFYRATYHDVEAFNRAKGKPFVQEVDEKSQLLYFKPDVDDAHPQNRRIKAKIEQNVLTFTDAKAPKRTYYTFVKLPGRSEIFGLASRNGLYDLRDFWRRPLKEQIDLPDVEVLLYDQAAIQPCDDILRELAGVSRERFVHFNLPLPTIWVRPGGWDPGVQWERLERIYGREFGYIGADSSVGGVWGGSRWTTGYDAMYFFDQGADITPEQLVDQIEKRLAAGKYHVTLSHMWNNKLPGRMDEYYQKTERFAQLLVDRKIPFLTMKGTLEARFGKGAVVGRLSPLRRGYLRADRRFAGIPSLAISPKNGRQWRTFYAGPTDGEDSNNFIVLATRADATAPWQEVLYYDPDGDGPRRAFDPELWVSPDGKLQWTWTERSVPLRDGDLNRFTHRDEAQKEQLMAVTLNAEDVPTPPYPAPRVLLGGGVMMCKPIAAKDGRWLYPVSFWNDDFSARIYASTDRGQTLSLVGSASLPAKFREFDEHNVVELKDGTLRVYMRTKNNPGWNAWQADSRDGGRTWEPSKPCPFPHTNSRLFVRRLQSGALLLVKNGSLDRPLVTQNYRGRADMTAYVSDDEGATWTGGLLLQAGACAYPDGDQAADGTIHVTCDGDRFTKQEIFDAAFTEADVRRAQSPSRK